MTTGNDRYKMIEAFAVFSNNTNRKLRFTSRHIAQLREANAIAASIRNKGNQNWKKRKPVTNEYRAVKSTDSKLRKWVNNGTEEKFTQQYASYINDGYSYGRLPFSNEWIQKYSTSIKGRKHTDEAKLKISQSKKGTIFTPEHCANMSASAKNRPRVICEHCGLSMIKSNYTKWHGDKCRKKH